MFGGGGGGCIQEYYSNIWMFVFVGDERRINDSDGACGVPATVLPCCCKRFWRPAIANDPDRKKRVGGREADPFAPIW